MANNASRSMQIHHDTFFEAKGVWRYRIEVWEKFMGRDRRLASFPAHANQLDRLQRRFSAQYGVHPENIITHPPEEGQHAGTEEKRAANAHGT